MKTLIEKWEHFMSEGQLVGSSVKFIINDMNKLAKDLKNFNPYPESERAHITDESKALLILQFQELERLMKEKFAEDLNNPETNYLDE